MQKITPFLWFDNNAEEAMEFYTSVFSNSKINNVVRYEKVPGPVGTVVTGTFTIEGQQFMVLNGGPEFKFNHAVSFFINCETQDEVDYFWEKLSKGGEEEPCGWVKDKFGLSWQIVPAQLGGFLQDGNREKAGRAMDAMFKMKKINIAAIEAAFNG